MRVVGSASDGVRFESVIDVHIWQLILDSLYSPHSLNCCCRHDIICTPAVSNYLQYVVVLDFSLHSLGGCALCHPCASPY